MKFARNVIFVIILGLVWMAFDIINQNNINTKFQDFTMVAKTFDLAIEKSDFVYRKGNE